MRTSLQSVLYSLAEGFQVVSPTDLLFFKNAHTFHQLVVDSLGCRIANQVDLLFFDAT